MTLTIAYHLDIVLCENGSVLESQCECKRGVGPDSVCKHRIILLYGITRHCAGEDIVMQQSKTQKLQTFHCVKPAKGSPKRCGNAITFICLIELKSANLLIYLLYMVVIGNIVLNILSEIQIKQIHIYQYKKKQKTNVGRTKS